MFKTLQTTLLIGVTPFLAILVGLGLWAVVMFTRLGSNIDKILRENYYSVRAAQGMKDALERMDSSMLFAIAGDEAAARAQFAAQRPEFEKHLRFEQGNVTLPHEQELVDELTALQTHYFDLTARFFALAPDQKAVRTKLYFAELLPGFDAVKKKADEILDLNAKNMEEERDRASEAARNSIRVMVISIAAASVLAAFVSLRLSRSILDPIRAVTGSARAMAKGDLDQVVPVVTRDELGELAAAFNTMARTIREFREAGTARLVRAQQTAQATIDSFPDPVVVVDPAGAVERANPSARRILGVVPSGSDGALPWTPPPLLKAPLAEVLLGGIDSLSNSLENALCIRDNGQERFFLPRVVAIRDQNGLLGAAVVLSDVTKFRLVDQLKSDMVSTVSHELKTPLTGVQMAVHLLLEEAVGPLNAKQIELLLAARQDSDRLLAMINDLLDLTRIEQGRITLDLRPVSPDELLEESLTRFHPKARDLGVELTVSPVSELPPVLVDADRVAHVFDNLVGNALSHTPRGGAVRLSAFAGEGVVRFEVKDNGEGIAAEHLPYLFDKFYRVNGPRKSRTNGAGLGLAIAREIVVSHGGEIHVKSRPGEGSTFTFTLPRVSDEPDSSRARAAE
jgi:NtrC-family two-component system sensor histidine kinase KinB